MATASPERAWAGQCLATEVGVDLQRQGAQAVGVDRQLAVPELAHVERPSLRPRRPAEEDVPAGLHELLAFDDPPPGVAVPAAGQMVLQHRPTRLLHLQEQGIVPVSTFKEPTKHRLPTLPTPTTFRATSTSSRRSSRTRRLGASDRR